MLANDPITPEELKSIKDNCVFWGNNCGGCEVCSMHFSNPPTYDFLETYQLVTMIEARNEKIKELEDKIKEMSNEK